MKTGTHPMQAKKDLARRIVADFHSTEAATKAGEDWAKQFQKDEVPEEIACVAVPLEVVVLSGISQIAGGHSESSHLKPIRVDRLVRFAGLAASNTEAAGKQKQGAVILFDANMQPIAVSPSLAAWVPLDADLTLRVGRRMKRVRIVDPGSGR
jgi:tyrosyl-tRNA synthetase